MIMLLLILNGGSLAKSGYATGEIDKKELKKKEFLMWSCRKTKIQI